jgi:hypothetical protein
VYAGVSGRRSAATPRSGPPAPEGRIVLHPAEAPDLHAAATLAVFTCGVEAADAFSDAREDASHDLSDDVARWSRAHPDRRLALVVVTPAAEFAP